MTSTPTVIHPRLQQTLSRLATVPPFAGDPRISERMRSALETTSLSWKFESTKAFELVVRGWLDWWDRQGSKSQSIISGQSLVAYLNHLRARGLSEKTIQMSIWGLRSVCRLVAEIAPEDMPTVLQRWGGASQSSDTQQEVSRPFRGMRYTDKNIRLLMDRIDRFSPQQVRNMAATLVIYETMLPPRKILGNWEYGRWQCPPALAGALKIFPSGEAELNFSVENGQVEKVSLSSLTVEWINRYRDLHPPSIHLFAGDRGKPFGDKHWLLSMRQMLRILGLPRVGFGLRSLRLGRAEDMLEAGIGMQDIRAAGRWKTLSIAYRLTADRSIESSQRSLEASKGKHKTAGDLLATDRNSTQYQAAIKRYRDFSTSGGPYTGDLFAA